MACTSISSGSVPISLDIDVMATGESQDERWSTSYRREIRRQQREILNDVHSKKESSRAMTVQMQVYSSF